CQGPLRPPQHRALPPAPGRRAHRPHAVGPPGCPGASTRADPGSAVRTRSIRLGFVGTPQSFALAFRVRRRRTTPSPQGRVALVLVIVAPGQGAQSPGFLTPWLADPTFRSRFEWLSTVAGIDLVEHGTNSDAETIRATEIAQPLLVA